MSTTATPSPAMERLKDFNLLVLGAIGTATLFCFYLLLKKDHDAPVSYNVTPPTQIQPGWKGEILKEPTLKVMPRLVGIRSC